MEQHPTQKKKIAPIRRVLAYYLSSTRDYAWLAIVTALSIVLAQIGDLLAPLYMRKFFDVLATHTPGPETAGLLQHSLLFVMGAWLFSYCMYRIRSYGATFFEGRVMESLFRQAFHILLGHSHNFFVSNFSGALTQRVSKYARAFEKIMDGLIFNIVPTLFYIIGAIVVLYIRNHTLGLGLLVWTVIFIGALLWLTMRQQPLRIARAAADTRLTATLADAISNHQTISLFSGARAEEQKLTGVTRAWYEATIRAWSSGNNIWNVTGFLMVCIESVIFFVAIRYWTLGVITIGDFVLIQVYLVGLFQRLNGVGEMLRGFFDSLADAGEMVAIFDTPYEVRDAPHASVLAVDRGNIEFSHVDFHFSKTRSIFTDFSMAIRAHEKVALVGPSGAGKSTIIKLLLRFHDVRDGSITIDNQNIAEVTQDSLREAIAFVPQEPILFHRTLMENIRYGRRDATDEDVIEAAKQAHCHEFISSLPEGYNTFVGERGVKLSGGERQRVAIARAILKNAPILVLDEATSSLDSESERLIQDALEVLMRGKTVIVIAHRLSTIMKMDRIVVIEGGSIVAEGTHDELLAAGGLYQKLWDIQAGGFISDEDSLADEEEER